MTHARRRNGRQRCTNSAAARNTQHVATDSPVRHRNDDADWRSKPVVYDASTRQHHSPGATCQLTGRPLVHRRAPCRLGELWSCGHGDLRLCPCVFGAPNAN